MLAYDQATKTFLYSVIQDDINKYNPDVSFNGLPLKANVAMEQAEFSDEAMRANTKYRLLVYSDTQYEEFYLSLTNLPVLRIEADTYIEDESLYYSDKTPATFTLFDNRNQVDPHNRLSTSDASLHIRGGSSRSYPKKSFRVSLSTRSTGGNKRSNHLSLLGMRADDDWILYSAYNDPEKVRNVYSSNLWTDMGAGNNQFGIQNGTHGKYLEVFINNKYWGLYALMYPVDTKQLSLVETSDVLTNDYHYRPNTYQVTTPEMLVSAGEGFTFGKYELYFPTTPIHDWQKWKPLADFLSILALDDEEFMHQYPSAVNIGNIIDLHIFLITSLAVDNNGKNLDIVAKYDGTRHILIFSPWDLDQTWGNVWGDIPLLFTHVALPSDYHFDPDDSGMSRALSLGIPGLLEQFQQRYQDLRSTLLSDQSLLDRLAEYETEIFGSGAMLRDTARWPLAAAATSMDNLENFIISRMAYMDRYVSGLGQEVAQ